MTAWLNADKAGVESAWKGDKNEKCCGGPTAGILDVDLRLFCT